MNRTIASPNQHTETIIIEDDVYDKLKLLLDRIEHSYGGRIHESLTMAELISDVLLNDAVDTWLDDYDEGCHTCPHCGVVWSMRDIDSNEDTEVLLISLGRCPDCYEGDLP